MTIEETFAKVVGRHASDDERQRLCRLRDALGPRDNDAFWSIVMALEYYDSFFRRYPAELAGYTERCIEDARAAFAAAAEREAAEVQRTLSGKVAETSVAIARRLAERPVGLHRVTMLLAAAVAFGALCVSAGYSLAAPGKPFWVTNTETLTPMEREAAVVLAAPAGWMVFALLLPAAVYAARAGWVTASETTKAREKIIGWGIVAACPFASDVGRRAFDVPVAEDRVEDVVPIRHEAGGRFWGCARRDRPSACRSGRTAMSFVSHGRTTEAATLNQLGR